MGARAIIDDLFARRPEGLVYMADAFSSADEKLLVQSLADLPFKPFAFHGYQGNRRVVSFGWRYDYSARRIAAVDPIPDFLAPLRAKAGALADVPPKDFVQALVTEYAPGAGIGWHKDKPEFGDVVGFSLLSPCMLRFRRANDGAWDRVSVPVAPRSAYLLRGEVRAVWQHSIAPMTTLRFSITFRTLRTAPEPHIP